MNRLPRNLSVQTELDNGNLYVVTRKGTICGSLWWQPRRKYTVHLEHLEVQPRKRQDKGLGELMLRAFLELLPEMYPKARHLSANATSQGVGRLLIRVFGTPVNGADLSPLPRKSPRDWIYARNAVLIRFSVRRANEGKNRNDQGRPRPSQPLDKKANRKARLRLLHKRGNHDQLDQPPHRPDHATAGKNDGRQLPPRGNRASARV